MSDEIIKVGMADLNIAKAPSKLTTLGLGSCVGITMYDKTKQLGGLVHIMLPSSLEIKKNDNRFKFADTGIDELMDRLIRKGAKKRNLVAKIAGGSQMFNFNSGNNILKIGERNVIATKEKLKSINIRIISEDTGGNFGRTIVLDPLDGSLFIRTIGHGEKTI